MPRRAFDESQYTIPWRLFFHETNANISETIPGIFYRNRTVTRPSFTGDPPMTPLPCGEDYAPNFARHATCPNWAQPSRETCL